MYLPRRVTGAELPSLPIYREIFREYSKISPISRSPAFDLQSPAKDSFCLFYAYFSIFLPAHRFASCESSTESAKSSRTETIQDAHNRTFLTGQQTGSDYI